MPTPPRSKPTAVVFPISAAAAAIDAERSVKILIEADGIARKDVAENAAKDVAEDADAELSTGNLAEHEAADADAEAVQVQEPRLWQGDGWTARVIKNDDDEGWAVAMIKDGEPEPALIGPWTMGRDKKNPKPLDTNAFSTLVKTANEFVRRHEQQRDAILHKKVRISVDGQMITIGMDITPDEDDPRAQLWAEDESGERLADISVTPNFQLTTGSARNWAEKGYPRKGA